MHSKGHAFYPALGHSEEVSASTTYHSLLLPGIQWAVGIVNADVRPTPVG